LLPVPVSITENLEAKIYSEGQTAYKAENNTKVKTFFSAIPDYKRSNDYLALINSKQAGFSSSKYYDDLIDLLGFEDTNDIIISDWSMVCIPATSRASRYNTLHLCSKGRVPKGGIVPFGNPSGFAGKCDHARIRCGHISGCQRTAGFSLRKLRFCTYKGKNEPKPGKARGVPSPCRQLFQIHGSIFEPHPLCYSGQASVHCITHG